MLNWISLIWDLKPCQISVKCGVGCRCFLHPMCFTNIWDSNCFKEFSFKVYPCRPLFVYEFCGFPPSVTSALSCLHFLLLPPFFFVFYCRFFRVVVSYAGIILFFFFFILLPSVGFADLRKRKPVCERVMWSKHVLE